MNEAQAIPSAAASASASSQSPPPSPSPSPSPALRPSPTADASVPSQQQGATVFYPHVSIRERAMQEVDPYDTLATYLFSKSVSNRMFAIIAKNALSRAVCIGTFGLGACGILFGVSGIYPQLGYMSVGVVPATILFSGLLNTQVLGLLVRTIEFWSLVLLIAFSTAIIIAEVLPDAPRVLATLMFFLASFPLVTTDARLFTKDRNVGYAYLVSFCTVAAWVVIILWWAGQWRDLANYQIQVGETLTISLLSIGVSAYTTFLALVTKYAYSLSRATEANHMVVLRADVRYDCVPPRQQLESRFHDREATTAATTSTATGAREHSNFFPTWRGGTPTTTRPHVLPARSLSPMSSNTTFAQPSSSSSSVLSPATLANEVEDGTQAARRPQTRATTLYEPKFVKQPWLKNVVPRDTVVRWFCGTRAANAVFHVTSRSVVSQSIMIAAFLFAGGAAFASLTGLYPSVGWAALGGVPLLACSVLLLNCSMVLCLVHSFYFWVVVVLNVIWVLCWTYGLRASAPRLAAAWVVFLVAVVAAFNDARGFVKTPKEQRLVAYLWTLGAAYCWLYTTMWWFGQWTDVDLPVILVEDVGRIDVMAVGMSAFTTFTLIVSSIAWSLLQASLFRAGEINRLVIIRMDIVFLPVVAGTPFRVPHPALPQESSKRRELGAVGDS